MMEENTQIDIQTLLRSRPSSFHKQNPFMKQNLKVKTGSISTNIVTATSSRNMIVTPTKDSICITHNMLESPRWDQIGKTTPRLNGELSFFSPKKGMKETGDCSRDKYPCNSPSRRSPRTPESPTKRPRRCNMKLYQDFIEDI